MPESGDIWTPVNALRTQESYWDSRQTLWDVVDNVQQSPWDSSAATETWTPVIPSEA